ncbi:MAG: MBL fold metallo-hydrolase [Bacteroidia bacterium]
MKYTCWGAARQVTGSMHHLELDSGFQILIDCGLDYEKREEANPNKEFPFDPKQLDVLVLTHAHIDHSGNIPNLVKQGFRGEIICTEPTAFLLDKLWADSVSIMNKDRKKSKQKDKLFGYSEVNQSLSQLLTLEFYQEFKLNEEVSMMFYEAGHILGAGSVYLELKEGEEVKKIGFSGDLGNYNTCLIVDPMPMPELNYLVTETTYGNRYHQVKKSPEEELKLYVYNNCVKQEGKLIIPAFSVGRTQAVLYTLNKLFRSGELPPVRIYADSPLGMASNSIHDRFKHMLNAEAKAHVSNGHELFDFKELNLVEDEEDQNEMNLYRGSSIVVSSAGMLEGGRIQDHISTHIENPACTILIAGFCTPGTLGAQLLQGNPIVRIKGRDRRVYANIAQTDVFSAHPDKDGLKKYIDESNNPNLKELFLVHGEEESILEFQEELSASLNANINAPSKGQSFEL